MLNETSRFHLVIDVIDRTPELGYRAAHVRQLMCDKLVEHEQCIRATGEDLPEVREWVWPAPRHP
jgi:xylulose-5-phosphate/fructose-6-phosphate phosphoketolase